MSEEDKKIQLKKDIINLCETISSVMAYMECLMKRYEKLENQLQQKENIIKEVREYIEKTIFIIEDDDLARQLEVKEKELLEILKGSDKE